jgi:hypothetical protein
MRVKVDQPGANELAICIDRLGGGLARNIAFDSCDNGVVDRHVCEISRRCRRDHNRGISHWPLPNITRVQEVPVAGHVLNVDDATPGMVAR